MEEVAGDEDRTTEQGMETELPRGTTMSTFTSRCWTCSAGRKRDKGIGGEHVECEEQRGLVCLLTIVELDLKCTSKPCVRFTS